MYTSDEFQIRDEETFTLRIPSDRDYKILQLTDLHLGFGIFSGKKDRLALAAVTELIRRTKCDWSSDVCSSDLIGADGRFGVSVFPEKRNDE